MLKAYSLGIITGSFLTAGLLWAIPAKADPYAASIAYADKYGAAICSTLDDYPSFNGILGIGQVIVDDGLNSTQAGYVIATAVGDLCPRHLPLLMAFTRRYSGTTA